MAEKVISTCKSCGARLSALAKRCHLCGWPVGSEDYDLRVEEDGDDIPFETESKQQNPVNEADGIYCNSCGWKNPIHANFCSSCGSKLQKMAHGRTVVAEDAPEIAKKSAPNKKSTPKEQDSTVEASSDLGAGQESTVVQIGVMANVWQIGMMVVAASMVVAALYMITVFSKRAFPTTEASPPQQAEAAAEGQELEAAPLSVEMEERIATLSAEADQLSGEAKIAKQREIVNALMSVQRFDRAAPFQEAIAQASGNADDWFQAGHFYYDWMDQLSGAQRLTLAQNAVSAYEQGLSMTNDLNVRTALAMAYLNTQTPMLGVQHIRQVLDEDPEHLQGNFYFGVMLMQINRLDQSKAQFERVKELVDETNPMYQQAEIMLRNLESLAQ